MVITRCVTHTLNIRTKPQKENFICWSKLIICWLSEKNAKDSQLPGFPLTSRHEITSVWVRRALSEMQFLSLHNLHALNVKAGTRTVSLLLVNVTCGRRRRGRRRHVLSSCVLCLLILIGVSDLHLVSTARHILTSHRNKSAQQQRRKIQTAVWCCHIVYVEFAPPPRRCGELWAAWRELPACRRVTPTSSASAARSGCSATCCTPSRWGASWRRSCGCRGGSTCRCAGWETSSACRAPPAALAWVSADVAA